MELRQMLKTGRERRESTSISQVKTHSTDDQINFHFESEPSSSSLNAKHSAGLPHQASGSETARRTQRLNSISFGFDAESEGSRPSTAGLTPIESGQGYLDITPQEAMSNIQRHIQDRTYTNTSFDWRANEGRVENNEPTMISNYTDYLSSPEPSGEFDVQGLRNAPTSTGLRPGSSTSSENSSRPSSGQTLLSNGKKKK